MIDFEAEPTELQAQLTNAYRQLPTLEQRIVQLFSVIYEPVNRASFVECFNQTGICNTNGKPFTVLTIKPYIEKLLKVGLLVQEQGQGPECHPLLVEIVTRDAVQAGQFEILAQAVEKQLPVGTFADETRRFSNNLQLMREVRMGIYRGDVEFAKKQVEDYHKCKYSSISTISLEGLLMLVCNNPFDRDWFRTLPQEFYEGALLAILTNGVMALYPEVEAFTVLQEECLQQGEHYSDNLRLLLIEQLLLRGQLQPAQQHLEQISMQSDRSQLLWGWLTFLQGDCEQAIEHYTVALKALRKAQNKKKVYFYTIGGIFFILALLEDGSPNRLREAQEYTKIMARQSDHWLSLIYARLNRLIQVHQGDLAQKEALVSDYIVPYEVHHSIETLFCALCLYWVDIDKAKKRLPKVIEPLYHQAKASGYHWLAMEAAELMSQLKPRAHYGKEAAALRHNSNIPTLIDLIQPKESWELCLSALANLHKESQTSDKAESELRLAWFITFSSSSSKCTLQPREQKLQAKGVWSKGRPISLRRLSEDLSEFAYLTPQDQRICAYIVMDYEQSYRYYGKTEYKLEDKAISALVGHPAVFWEDSPTTRVEIVKGEPELFIKKEKRDRLLLELSPKLLPDQEILVLKETPTRLKVIEINAEQRRIAELLGAKSRLEVPALAKERVLAVINAVSRSVTVHSDIGGEVESALEVTAQTKPHVHLLPVGEGFKVSLLSRPFAQGGPYYRPGASGETVIAEIDGRRLQTTRNLDEEKQLAKAVLAACPTLSHELEENGEWLLEDLEDCLQLLLELQALGDTVVLEWPEGEKLRISHYADFNNFQLGIQRQGDWFAASGELRLDEHQVLDMQHLLELLEQTPSRFIALGKGQFLALTQEFRRRLDELRAFSEKHGKNRRFHPLAALAIEDLATEVGTLKTDQHWKAHIQRLKEAQSLEPKLPSTLQAELRDYQIEGFQWLARLAHWGVGACLADDMGLGKTLQALAVILTRASEGPTLIVAPTSVCMNWVSEAQRFTPTLNIILFGGGDRQKVLEQLQPFDTVICSYGFLQQEEVAEMLSQVQWQTIVLDEAQLIKNIATKRSQAAMNLQGGFKLITTGTPIENHLGELWNLFRFINPGLLGSLESFNQRFAIPIEKLKDKQARNRLKKLIQPFLLRRTKNQVLEELPSRTEITLYVELSQEETALYEALRREAIAKLAESEVAGGQKHLQVLAEIMRLRRACCNARLVMPDTQLLSSKLQLFAEVLGELLANRHKALVFSQFVDHLQIIRDFLNEQEIHYQYLDGSTPAAERKKRVNAFQSGEGNVFLISLKAGGTGLNLTAADYVIHMDPWWNPAVEDQASDRAHRIGQQRPVTIYRLVAKDTIEEKIVSLHQHKRDLADSLLEGTDISGKISTEMLLQLIQES